MREFSQQFRCSWKEAIRIKHASDVRKIKERTYAFLLEAAKKVLIRNS